MRAGTALAWSAPLAAVAALATLRIGDEAIYSDELASLKIASQPPGTLVETLWQDEANMGPYYIALHGWLRLGSSLEWMRALSVLGGLAAVAATMHLGRRWFGPRVGWLAGAFLGIHPMFLDYLTEARAYSWATAAAVLATAAVGAAPSRRTALWYGVATGLGTALNLVNGLLVASHAVALRVTGAPRRRWRLLLVGASLAALLVLPFAPAYAARREDQASWISSLDPVGFLASIKDLCGGESPAVLTVAVLAWLLWRFHADGRLQADLRAALVLAGTTVPILGLALISLVRPLFVDRYLIGVVPFIALGLALAVERASASAAHQAARRVGGAALVALVLVVGGWPVDEDRRRESDPTALAEHLAATTESDEVVLVSQAWILQDLRLVRDLREVQFVLGGDPRDADWLVGLRDELDDAATCFGYLCVLDLRSRAAP